MNTEALANITADRAQLIAAQLGWQWETTTRTDTDVTLRLKYPSSTLPQTAKTQVITRLEAVLEAMGWELISADITTQYIYATLRYQLTPPEITARRTDHEEAAQAIEEETAQ